MGDIEINSDRQRLFKLEGSRKEFSQEAPVCVGELGPRFPCFTQLKTPQKRNVSLCRFLVSEQYFIEGTHIASLIFQVQKQRYIVDNLLQINLYTHKSNIQPQSPFRRTLS